MNAQDFKTRWPELQNRVGRLFPALTPEDLNGIDGEVDALTRTLAARYDLSTPTATRETQIVLLALDRDASEELSAFWNRTRERVGPAAQELREGFEHFFQALRDVAGDAADTAKTGAEVRVAAARDGALAAGQAVREQAGDWLERTDQFVRERPYTSLGIAFAAGWLLFGRR